MQTGYGEEREAITKDDQGNLVVTENIIESVHAARAIHMRYRQDHAKRIYLYSLIQGLIGGNPPYDPIELRQHGLAHISNFSTLDGTSLYEKAGLAYWNLLNQTEHIVKFKLKLPGDVPEIGEVSNWQDIMSRNWDYVIRQWPSFTAQMNMLSAQLVLFGVSPVIWPDERDWQFEVTEISKFFIEDMASTDIAKHTGVCIESYTTIQELFEIYENFKDSDPKDDSIPWNVNELKELIVHISGGRDRTTSSWPDMLELKRKYQNGDCASGTLFTDSVRLVTLLYKEYDGKISQYRFHRDFDAGEFLFAVDRQYDSMEDALIVYTMQPGEFTIHANKGIGHKVFSMVQAKNQLDCSLVDMAKWASTPIIKNPVSGYQEIDSIRFTPGVPTNIGSSEFVNNTLAANMDNVIGVSNYIDQKLQFNLATSGDDPAVPDADTGSKAPAELRTVAYKEWGVLKNSIAHYYNYSDRLFRTMFKRMWFAKKGWPNYEYVEEWKGLCIADGVPEEIFNMNTTKEGIGLNGMPRHIQMYASRVAGDGSTLARIMGLEGMGRIVGDLGPKALREYERQYIMTHMGDDYVEAFMQDKGAQDETSGGASLAAIENAIMEDGKGAVFSKDNEQKAHFVVHMSLASRVIEQVTQQQIDAIGADKIFTVLVPHLREHFQSIASSPFAGSFVAQMKGPYGQVEKYAQLMRKNAVAMMQKEMKAQDAEQQKMGSAQMEEQRKDFLAKKEAERKDYDVMKKNERADRANAVRGQIMSEKNKADAEIKREKVLLDADNERLKTQLENPREVLVNMQGKTPSPYDIE
jgi:hypothetical protein